MIAVLLCVSGEHPGPAAQEALPLKLAIEATMVSFKGCWVTHPIAATACETNSLGSDVWEGELGPTREFCHLSTQQDEGVV